MWTMQYASFGTAQSCSGPSCGKAHLCEVQRINKVMCRGGCLGLGVGLFGACSWRSHAGSCGHWKAMKDVLGWGGQWRNRKLRVFLCLEW